MKFPTGCLYTNKKTSFRSPWSRDFGITYVGVFYVGSDGDIYYSNWEVAIEDSYGLFELKFLIVYNSIEVGRKNTSSGYFIFFIKVH